MENFLKMSGIGGSVSKDGGRYMKQAENIWSMLDEMATSSPDSYKFV